MLDTSWLLVLLPFITAGGGAYLGAYLKKKGENLATHEDIAKLVHQVKAVTETAKQIEAAIADDFWAKQRRWELKRDIMLSAIEQLANIQGDTSKATAMTAVVLRLSESKQKVELEENIKAIARSLIDQTSRLMSMTYRVALVSGPTVQQMVARVQQVSLEIPKYLLQNNIEGAMGLNTDIERATQEALAAIRNELGFPAVQAHMLTTSEAGLAAASQ